MCRFKGVHDKEYEKVESALQRIIAAGNQDIHPGNAPAPISKLVPGSTPSGTIPESRLRKLVLSLTFPHNRYLFVEKAHPKTCRWLLSIPEYVSWVKSSISCPDNFLWIKGNPGSGKSTIMKFAFSQAKQIATNPIAIRFFFNARGEPLERSTLGCYRSILFQLLQTAPELQPILASLVEAPEESVPELQWNINILKEIFSSALKEVRGRPILCYIDALDECDRDEIRNMISFFLDTEEEAAAAGVHSRVCLSSRHYPHVPIRKGVSFDLERQDQHDQDIATYIDSELCIGDGDIATEVKQRVLDKASGIFLWVKLVVDILNKEYDDGKVLSLRTRLDAIPGDLYELFKDILTRDCENLEALWMCIQWVLFAKKPLNREGLYFAILSGTDPARLSPWDRKEITASDMGRYILSCSKGLVLITPKLFTVQFIHESVRDFLIKENGLGRLWPQFLNNFTGRSHAKLRECCEACLSSVRGFDQVDTSNSEPIHPDSSSRLQRLYPFLKYAVDNVFYHAELAQALKEPQNAFLQSFDFGRWVVLSNSLQRFEVRYYSREASMLYVLSEQDAHHLVSIHPQLDSTFDKPYSGRYGFPLYAAFTNNNIRTVRVLLSAMMGPGLCECGIATPSINDYTGPEPSPSTDLYPYETFWLNTLPGGGLRSHAGPSLDRMLELGDSALLHALLRQNYIRKLLESREFDIHPVLNKAIRCKSQDLFLLFLAHDYVPRDPRVRNSFLAAYAAARGFEAIIRIMLDPDNSEITNLHPLSPDASVLWSYVESPVDWNGETALARAAGVGNLAIVKLLLDSGRVNPNGAPCNGKHEIPLSEALRNGHADVAELLLRTNGIDPDPRGWSQPPPLHLAIVADNGMPDEARMGITELLLASGRVDPFSVESAFGTERLTPLLGLALHGWISLVELALKTYLDSPSFEQATRALVNYMRRLSEGYQEHPNGVFFAPARIEPSNRD